MGIESERTDDRSIFSYQRMIFRYRYARKYLHPGSVLDIGCGYGYQAGFMQGYDYVGVDYYPKAAIVARQSHPEARFLAMQAPPLSFKDNSFDNVICAEMIEHVTPDLALPLVRECHRVLKPGGIFFLSTPNAQNRLQKAPDHYIEYSVSDVHQFLAQTGFNVLRRGGLSLDLVRNRFDTSSKFNAFRKKLYSTALGKKSIEEDKKAEDNEPADKDHSSRAPQGKKKIFTGVLRMGLTGLSKVVVHAGHCFPSKAEYQVWICRKV